VTLAILDDHLLRDVLAAEASEQLAALVETHEVATTNMYFVRLCKSAVAARGAQLTGGWSVEPRRALAQRLVQLPESIQVVPMRLIGFRMAELADAHRLSTLGAEAVAASEQVSGSLCVWEGDDGPGIRAAAQARGVTYVVVAR
jgi:hypothetical protein